MRSSRLKAAFLVSGEGSTLAGVAERIRSERLAVEIVLVVSDRPDAPALARAREAGLPTLSLPPRPSDPTGWSEALSERLEAAGAELVVLAGFLSILPDAFVRRWRGRAVNLHPSLLPQFGGKGLYGRKVHEAVLASGAQESGASVHLLTEEIDRGAVLAQVRLAVRPDETPETLRTRLHPHEVILLTEVLRRVADGTIPLPIPDGGSGAGPPAG